MNPKPSLQSPECTATDLWWIRFLEFVWILWTLLRDYGELWTWRSLLGWSIKIHRSKFPSWFIRSLSLQKLPLKSHQEIEDLCLYICCSPDAVVDSKIYLFLSIWCMWYSSIQVRAICDGFWRPGHLNQTLGFGFECKLVAIADWRYETKFAVFVSSVRKAFDYVDISLLC